MLATHDGVRVYAVGCGGLPIIHVEAPSPDDAWMVTPRLASGSLMERLTRSDAEVSAAKGVALVDGAEVVWMPPLTCRYPCDVPERPKYLALRCREDGAE
jgi:hypothetical protein